MPRNKLLVISLFLLLSFAFQVPVFGQEAEIAAIEKKKRDHNIRWGEADALSIEEAKQKAELDLARKFKSVMTGSSSIDMSNTTDGGSEDYTESMTRSLYATIDNMREISYSVTRKNKNTKADEKWYCVFVYITEQDYQQAQEDRREEERGMILSGISQEEELRLAGALKYYNWALTVIRAYNDDDLTITVGGKEENAKRWLETKIESVLSNLQFEVNENSVEVHDEGYDKYTVLVSAKYAGNPVSSLDIRYFNGDDFQEVRANDGMMTLGFPDLEGISGLDFKIQYLYSTEAKNAGGIVESIYKEPKFAHLLLDLDNIASVKVPFKFNAKKRTAKKTGLNTRDKASTDCDAAAPIIKPARTATPEKAAHRLATTPLDYLTSMQSVEKALRSKDYGSVRHLFTPEGFDIFDRLTSTSKIRVVGKPEYKIEETELFTIGRAIPVSVSRDHHSTTENLVFRFEKGTKKIKSVAFALTERAENDIFRAGADWHIDSRYSILTFMEDYQTAFHTQDINYISKIFSNNAIIITGSFANDNRGTFSEDVLQTRGKRHGKNVVFKRQTKTEYLSNLEKCFKRNKWTHIDFEEADMQKIDTGGLIDNDVMWIEIRQNWKSNSYCDVGYLSLQINLVPNGGSKINVRTWTPDFVPIDTLKERFPVNL